MAKSPEARCPGVRTKIAEVEGLNAAGDCWCKCVEDDLPKAKDLAGKGFCFGAMKVIKAARARCEAGSSGRGGYSVEQVDDDDPGSAIVPYEVTPIEIEPIKPIDFSKPVAIQGVIQAVKR